METFLIFLFKMLVKSVIDCTAHCSQHSPTEDCSARDHNGYHAANPQTTLRTGIPLCVIYLQPSVYLDCLDPFYQSLIHIRPMTIIKPQSKDSEKEKYVC